MRNVNVTLKKSGAAAHLDDDLLVGAGEVFGLPLGLLPLPHHLEGQQEGGVTPVGGRSHMREGGVTPGRFFSL